ncbi:MAG: glyoxalase [Proteobacteria bacterium]|nr:MAG: glyoxalase [Pseudomonadota bacterium]
MSADSPLEEFQGRPSFHVAFGVTDLEAARAFYVDVLGCRVGRSTQSWMDFDFFGFQITAHLVAATDAPSTSLVEDHDIPVPHFGLVMAWEDWHRAVDHMSYIGVSFRVEPHVRFKGKCGEQATFFIADPSGNCLEFKAFKEPGDIFRS